MIFLLSLLMITTNTPDKPTLIYVGDPMCSWCYGVAEELDAAMQELGDDVAFELVVGGLRSGGGDQWNAEFKDFLKHHWEDVSAASGQPFGYDLLQLDHFDYDTEPACRAVVVAQSIDKKVEFQFFKSIQKKFYVDNEDPKQTAFYESICKEVGLDFAIFSTRFESDSYKSVTLEHFQKARSLGVSSFPTILLKQGDNYQVVARGFTKSADMVSTVRKSLP